MQPGVPNLLPIAINLKVWDIEQRFDVSRTWGPVLNDFDQIGREFFNAQFLNEPWTGNWNLIGEPWTGNWNLIVWSWGCYVLKRVFEHHNPGLFFSKKIILMEINMKSQYPLGKIDEKLTDVAMKLISLVSIDFQSCVYGAGLQYNGTTHRLSFANDSRKIINLNLERIISSDYFQQPYVKQQTRQLQI